MSPTVSSGEHELVKTAVLYAEFGAYTVSWGEAYKVWGTGRVPGRATKQGDIHTLFFTDHRLLAIKSSKLNTPGISPYAPDYTSEILGKVNGLEEQLQTMIESGGGYEERPFFGATYKKRLSKWDLLASRIGNSSSINTMEVPVTQGLVMASDTSTFYEDVKRIRLHAAGSFRFRAQERILEGGKSILSVESKSNPKAEWKTTAEIEDMRSVLGKVSLASKVKT